MVKSSLEPGRARCAVLLLVLTALAGAGVLAIPASPPGGAAQATSGQRTATPAQTDALLRIADDVGKEVEALRGWSFKQPIAKQFTTPRQVGRYIERNLEANFPPGEIAIVEAMLRLAGLIPPTCDLRRTFLALMENQIAGYYDPETRTMNLVERPGGMPALVERMMLAHELTHALDDQYVDLKALVRPPPAHTEDSEFTVGAVTEGSATSLMLQYVVRAQASGKVNLSELAQYAAQEAERSKPFLEAPRYFSSVLASYICGTQFLAKGDLMSLLAAPDNRSIGESLMAARKDLPRSSEQILHPAKYWDAAQRDEPVLLDDDAVQKWLARPGRWVVHKDTFGELLVAILTTPKDKAPNLAAMQTAEAWTTPAARGWGGDRFYLLASGSSAEDASRRLKDPKGVWITAWDTPDDREEFALALASASPASVPSVAPMGPAAAIVFFGFDQAERDALTARLGDSGLPMTRDGKAWPPAVR